ncbi:MAG TPA: tyrosine-type recombinase/integrase, partial [Herpetosiphonaceae bacterium]
MSNAADPDGADPPYQVASRPLPALATVCDLTNTAAALAVFIDYRSQRAPLTTRRQTTDLALFGTYLQGQGFPPGALDEDPAAWQGVTWSLVEGFVAWQLSAGYAVGTVNIRLATVKTYARLAFRAGAIPHTEHLLIGSIPSYRRHEAERLDQQRPISRRGSKKAAPLLLTPDQARRLKHQPLDTPTGRRDALLMCLLVDHGLRRSEIHGLRAGCIALEQGTLTFYRPSVDRTETQALTADTLRAARHYLA